MNLNQTQLAELNALIKSANLELPFHKREVHPGGTNYSWLQKNITKRNPNVPDRLKELLGIEISKKVLATEVEGG